MWSTVMSRQTSLDQEKCKLANQFDSGIKLKYIHNTGLPTSDPISISQSFFHHLQDKSLYILPFIKGQFSITGKYKHKNNTGYIHRMIGKLVVC